MDIVPLFCDVDDFCNAFEPTGKHRLLADGNGKRQRAKTLYLSEVMTIIIWFHHSSYRTFKAYYTQEVVRHLSWAFPPLVSYNRFVELMQEALIPLCAYLQTRKGRPTGIALIDSLPITVCHHRRIASHKVFAGLAQRGKNSVD